MRKLLLACSFIFIGLAFSWAQTSDVQSSLDSISQVLLPDTEEEVRKSREFRGNILGGPGYTPDYGVLVGGSALMTFVMNPQDTVRMRSVVPLSFAFMFKSGFNVGFRPQLFFKNDRLRVFGQFRYKNTLDNYYGIGYATNKDYERGEETSEFRYNQLQFNPWVMFRVRQTDFFVGPQLDLNYDKFKEPAEGVIRDPSYIKDGGTADGYSNFSSGVGFLASYDTRDIPANAYRGVFLDAKGMWYNKILGSDNNFYKLELEYRQYKLVGDRKVIAWTIQSENVFGRNIPINKYVLTGTPFDLRGYYMGQYRDKTSHVLLAEYRQMVNTDGQTRFKRLLNRVGFATWAGSGFMGPNPVKIEGVLPNVGAGLRVEIQPRMNVRLDVGRNFINNSTLFYMNMTEAF
ncbi:MAG: BamA/TamA family outer membrane protein [Candidatus Azobacteroides sp.]|nr:BamA/TamA family outer membrane protein [Candidatus Azobacteroides sp.]